MWKCLGWRPWDIYKTKLFILVAFQFVFIAIYWFGGVVVAYEWQTTLDVARRRGSFQVAPSTIFNTDLGGNIIRISSCWLFLISLKAWKSFSVNLHSIWIHEFRTFLTTSTGVCVGTWNKRTFLFIMIAHTYNQEELMEMWVFARMSCLRYFWHVVCVHRKLWQQKYVAGCVTRSQHLKTSVLVSKI